MRLAFHCVQVGACVAARSVKQGHIPESVYIHHIHDEAIMRFRSYDRVQVEAFGEVQEKSIFSRGRYSKVQNNAVSVAVGASTPVDWPCELQPVGRKDGATMASAVIGTTQPILDAVTAGARSAGAKSIRVLHLLMGDGVNTNENVAKRLLHFFMLQSAGGGPVQYRLLVWKCSSHQANLVVLVAIAGSLMKDPLESSALCGTLSRLYKYLVPSYLEGFTAALRNIVVDSFVIRHDTTSAETLRHQEHSKKLAMLYGNGVLPQQLLSVRNRDLSKMEHVAPEGCDVSRLKKDMFDCLLRLVWVVEEKPVVTRFFLFAPCCFALLRMFLLGLPA